MRFVAPNRSVIGMTVNGNIYLIKEWNGQTLLRVIGGLGHSEGDTSRSKLPRAEHSCNYKTIWRRGDQTMRAGVTFWSEDKG